MPHHVYEAFYASGDEAMGVWGIFWLGQVMGFM